jgi:signal transduction histidine kinase
VSATPGRRIVLARSASLRLAVVYALIFAASALALISFFYETAGLLTQQVQQAINADIVTLVERFNEGGIPGVASTMDDRVNANVEDDALYLLVDPFRRKLAGNLARWPNDLARFDQFYEMPILRGPGLSWNAEVKIEPLPGGYALLVGRDVRARAQIIRLLTNTLLYAALLVTALGIAGGVVMRNLFRRMVSDVSRTADAIAGGDLTQRVRLRGMGDEFDRMAETINTMLDRIARLMDGVKQVSNAIAHDLRTPIARARARLEDAAEHATGEGELRAAVERAVSDLDGITAVFQALLRIAEIEAGSRRSAFGELDLGPLLADLADLYLAPAEEQGLTLTLAVPDTLPMRGDRELLQQAVANLLDNAIKFSPRGGSVEIRGEKAGAQVLLSVRDRGPGIPEEDRRRATERFFRGEQARNTPGSGLGLALVQAVASLHGGTLALEDAQPGLRAVLRLPASMTPASSEPHTPAALTAADWHE